MSENSQLEQIFKSNGALAEATLFARGEGIWWGTDELYFAFTNGGAKKLGQIFRLRPGMGSGGDALDLDQPYRGHLVPAELVADR